jgi:hypothetical protein
VTEEPGPNVETCDIGSAMAQCADQNVRVKFLRCSQIGWHTFVQSRLKKVECGVWPKV